MHVACAHPVVSYLASLGVMVAVRGTVVGSLHEMNTQDIEYMSVSELRFDYKNPRLPEFDFYSEAPETDVIRILWDAMDVRELVMSISASGFFRQEPLIVAEEGGKNVVIEGNRRLAAVKLLLDPSLVNELELSVQPLDEEARLELNALPVIRSSRADAWRYLGFKHVNGPAKWGSYAKSKYISEVHRNYNVSLEDIGVQIGDTHRTVRRLYRGLMVIEQAERLEVFNRNDRWRRHFSFSHIYTGIDYPNISKFIGLRSENPESTDPVPHERKVELGELCLWIYGSKKRDIPAIVERQNPDLRYLEAVLGNVESVTALREGVSLAVAFEISRPASNLFREALISSKRSLERAHSKRSAGYDGSEELLRIAGTVATLAEDLYEAMKRKHHTQDEKERLTANQ